MKASNISAFKAAILADPALTAFLAAGNDGSIAAYYNAPGTGLIWRPSIQITELNTAIVWSDFALLSALLQNTYIAMISSGFVDATSARIRNGFSTVFTIGASLTNLTAIAQQVPTRFEALFTTAQVTTEFGTQVRVEDVVIARTS